MTDYDTSLGHHADTIKTRVANLAWQLRHEHGDLDRLDGRIMDNAWVTPGCLPIQDLANAEKELRALAESLKSRREQLIATIPQAAE